MLQAAKNNKLNITLDEDVKTSTIIGEMLHLPSDLFWYFLHEATADNKQLPMRAGDIESVEFWPHWSAEGQEITNARIVEPDVFIRFEDFDLILEAKRTDDIGQYTSQWINEICSYINEYGHDEKDIVLIALGGNNDLHSTVLNQGKAKGQVVFKCRWLGLLAKIDEQLNALNQLPYKDSHTMQVIRVLQDVVSSFNMYGDHIMDWLQDIPQEIGTINKESIKIIEEIWRV